MGFAKAGGRIDKREESVSFVEGTEAGIAKAKAEEEAGTAIYWDNAKSFSLNIAPIVAAKPLTRYNAVS